MCYFFTNSNINLAIRALNGQDCHVNLKTKRSYLLRVSALALVHIQLQTISMIRM